MFNMINRINEALQVDLEDQSQIDLIKKSVRLDAAALHGYVLRAAAQQTRQPDGAGHQADGRIDNPSM